MLLVKGRYGSHQKELLKTARFQPSRLMKAINEGTMWDSVNDLTHIHDHVNQSPEQLIETLYNGTDKDVVSTFSNDETMQLCVEEALTYYAEEIAIWLSESPTITEPVELRIELGDEEWEDFPEIQPKGTGIIRNTDNNTVAEYETNIYSVILTKAPPHAYSDFGFTVRTAYPNLRQYGAQPTGKDLRPHLHETNYYKRAEPVEKAYLDHCYTPKQSVKAVYHDSGIPSVNIPIPSTNPTLRHNCQVTPHSRSVRTYDHNNDFVNVPYEESVHIIRQSSAHAAAIQNLQQNMIALSEQETTTRRLPQVPNPQNSNRQPQR